MPDSETDQSSSSNIVNLPDGTQHVFPSDASPEEMQKALSIGVPRGPVQVSTSPSYTMPQIMDSLRPFIAGAAGTGAAAGAAMIPVAGEIPGVPLAAESLGYGAVDYLLKKLNPNTEAQRQAKGDEVTDSIKDGLINAVGGRVINGIFKGVQAFRNADLPEIYKFSPTTSQALEALGWHKMATLSKFAEDFGATGAKADALDKAGGAGFTQALSFANALNGRTAAVNVDPVKLADKLRGELENHLVPASGSYLGQNTIKRAPTASEEALNILNGGKNPFQKLDDVIQDPDKLAKVLKVGQLAGSSGMNVRRDLQAYQFMRMINDGTTKDAMGNIRIDPNKIANIWNDSELKTSLDTLYGKQGREDVSNFIKNIAYTQDKQTDYPIAKQVRFVGNGFNLLGSLLTGNLHAAGGAAATLAGFYIPTAVAGRLLVNPSVSKLLGKMAAGEPLGVPTQYAGKSLVNALQGLNIAMIDAKGNKTWGQIKTDSNGDGTFVPAK